MTSLSTYATLSYAWGDRTSHNTDGECNDLLYLLGWEIDQCSRSIEDADRSSGWCLHTPASNSATFQDDTEDAWPISMESSDCFISPVARNSGTDLNRVASQSSQSPWLSDAIIGLEPELHAFHGTHESISSATIDSMSEPCNVSCAVCKLMFSTYQQLEKHGRERDHLPFECSEPGCNKRLSRRDTMQRHMAKHKSPQFNCGWCRKGFVRRDHMKLHRGKCPMKVGSKQESQCGDDYKVSRRSSTVSTTSSSDGTVRQKAKLKELIGQVLPPDQVCLLQQHLDTLSEVRTQSLCKEFVRTIIDEASDTEKDSIRFVDVSSHGRKLASVGSGGL